MSTKFYSALNAFSVISHTLLTFYTAHTKYIPIYGEFFLLRCDTLQYTRSLPMFQGDKVTCRVSQGSSACWLLQADYLIGLLFYPEGAGIMLLWNISDLLLTYRLSDPRRLRFTLAAVPVTDTEFCFSVVYLPPTCNNVKIQNSMPL
jgi:hypothetical protein